ncbi:MAG: hypothetical protein JNL58_06560 [Planctomyces sp.]|nr:hypothetical protein [Planctomyces sp.]
MFLNLIRIISEFVLGKPGKIGSESPPSLSDYDAACRSSSSPFACCQKHLVINSDIDEIAACRKVIRRLEQQLNNSVMDLRNSAQDATDGFCEIARLSRNCIELAETSLAEAARGREMAEVVCRIRGTLDGIALEQMLFQSRSSGHSHNHQEFDRESLTSLAGQLNELDRMIASSRVNMVNASVTLSQEISETLMALQLQDRVSQQIEHVAAALSAIQDSMRPFEQIAVPGMVQARLKKWTEYLKGNCTMESERMLLHTTESQETLPPADDAQPVELF